LKLHHPELLLHKMIVAPPAGAWIETQSKRGNKKNETVAPPAGAWIETYNAGSKLIYIQSRPLRARGLKRVSGL